MLFRGVLSGATQGAGNEKKWTPPTRNAIFHVILKCSFWSRKIKKTLFFTGKSIKKLQNLPIHPKGRKIKFLQRALFRGVTHVIMYCFFFPRKFFCERGAQNPLARTLLFGRVNMSLDVIFTTFLKFDFLSEPKNDNPHTLCKFGQKKT